jgi:Flp pilus assembly protein protease CpaA
MTFASLALLICIIWAMAIALIDLITYRISNFSLVLGMFLVWPALLLADQRFQITLSAIVLAVVALVAGLASLVGMGDVKLLLFLAPWLHYDNLRDPFTLLIALSWLQLTAGVVFQRSLPQRIAFAPAILAAAALNMAT